MPQPFLGKCVSIDGSAIAARPEIALHISTIASLWARIELELGYFLAAIMREDAEIGIAMYSTLKSEPARKAAMLAAVEACASPWNIERLQNLLDRVYKTGSTRDKIVHGIWGTSSDYPDCLVLLDSRKLVHHYASVHSQFAALEGPGWPRVTSVRTRKSRSNAHLTSARVYSDADFVVVERDLQKRLIEVQSAHAALFAGSPQLESLRLAAEFPRRQ